jgi:hypothetical protein
MVAKIACPLFRRVGAADPQRAPYFASGLGRRGPQAVSVIVTCIAGWIM